LASVTSEFNIAPQTHPIFLKDAGNQVARKKYGKQLGKIFAAIVLLIVTVIGLSYGSLLRSMNQAAEDYSRGDVEAALKRYGSIEQRLRSTGTLRLLPAEDRRNLILNQARLLYALGRYDEAQEAMDRESEIAGATNNDARFLLLKGEIAFRKAVKNYRDSYEKDTRILEEALRTAEDNLRDSLRLSPNDWDAKYNFEYVNYIRNILNGSQQAQMNILMDKLRTEKQPPTNLPAQLSP
jgi:tetratricopeptide (TPR) repeat protein